LIGHFEAYLGRDVALLEKYWLIARALSDRARSPRKLFTPITPGRVLREWDVIGIVEKRMLKQKY
jgi:hypothetical protein